MKQLFSTALVGVAALAFWPMAAAAEFVPNDVLISDPDSDLPDPEFDVIDNHVIWQSTDGDLWIARIDPVTGDMTPLDGRGQRLDTGLRPFGLTGNGPEWAYGDGQPYFAYTLDTADSFTTAAGVRQRNLGWTTTPLQNAFRRTPPAGTPPSHVGPPRIAYNYFPENADIAVGWRDLLDPSSERIVRDPSIEASGARWIEGEDRLFALFRPDRYQIGMVDITARRPTLEQATFSGYTIAEAFAWHAPEYDEPLLVTMLLGQARDAIGIHRRSRNDPDVWNIINAIEIPSDTYPLVSSPEAFVHNGRSYVVTAVTAQRNDDGFTFQPKGPSEIWIAGIDPDTPFFRRIDDPGVPFPDQPERSEPEVFPAAGGPVVYYSELKLGAFGQKIRMLRRADTGLGPEWGYDRQDYVGAWSTVHRDNRNSGATPFPIADGYREAGVEILANAQNAHMVMGPEGQLYMSLLRNDAAGITPQFRAIDTRLGMAEVFTLSNDDLSPGFVATNALISEDGNFYISGDSQITGFTPDGTPFGSVEVPGVSRGLHFGPDGNILAFTWNGWFQSTDPDTGDVTRQNLTPDRTFDTEAAACFDAGSRSNCAYIDTPAIDPIKSIVYATYTGPSGDSQIEAWYYDQTSKGLVRFWTSAPIRGNVSPPVLSADYTRLYYETEAGVLTALNTSNGAAVWSAFLGYSNPLPNPPVVNEFGYILPGGAPNAVEVAILRDHGPRVEVAFRSTAHRPLSTAAAGRGNRFVLAARKNGTPHLVVVHPFHGIISETRWRDGPAPGAFTGVVLREDGWVFLGGGETTSFKAYRPIWPQ